MSDDLREQIAAIEADRAALPEDERLRVEAADAPLLRVQLAHLAEELAAVRRQFTAAQMARNAAEAEARTVGADRDSALRSHTLQAGIAGSLAKELRTAQATIDRVRAHAEAMRSWCSPYGVATNYGVRLLQLLDNPPDTDEPTPAREGGDA